ncbi:DNA cytosine methyltransferase [Bacillus subtilis]|uniref:DNA cytosine methyltransferase n=1 Tax=Bacillus TaxID=1386 RepID=UPI000517A957|nr:MULTISPECIES: DNA cytosine methyltransferase [Bacillus]MEC2198711.1 DNA cytosine methyltransferase [Bacillus subtilis]MEC2333194.1 DNA cytosine methyltransferase [Bacillus subtilis]QHM01979.1 Modification methylase HaeIII [Bacillus subtilis]QPD80076.1 DNA (cytosine-5-)-methyltransferase [Bacillus subtilis]QYX69733.1 DNA cytosine methyltransferase [Bacillus subtilis]
MSYPIFSFFSGSGFLDLGFENSGFDVVYVNEIHTPFLKSYKHSRNMLKIEEPRFGYHNGDITELLEQEHLREYIDIIKSENSVFGFIGGPPCPDFSVGGKNRGREGENGKLSGTYVDLICQHKPSFFLFENVKGLWRTKRHREFFEEMKSKLHANGYVTTERLINSLEYGSAQHRERIILLGFRRELLDQVGYNIEDKGIDAILPNGLFPWENHLKYSMEKIENIPWPIVNEFEEDSVIPKPEDIIEELTVEHWFRKNDVDNHPNSKQFFTPRAGLAKFLVIEEGDDSKKSYKRLHRWRYSPTAAYGNNEVHLHPYKARRLTVAEALAIQSLPKNFEIPTDISLTDAFKTVGNGVPYLASLGIAETIKDFLGGYKRNEINRS